MINDSLAVSGCFGGVPRFDKSRNLLILCDVMSRGDYYYWRREYGERCENFMYFSQTRARF